MTAANKQIAEEIGALLAPVGENWWAYREAHPETEMYYEDGAHACRLVLPSCRLESLGGRHHRTRISMADAVTRTLDNKERRTCPFFERNQ